MVLPLNVQDKWTQTESQITASVHCSAFNVKCVNCTPMDYCCSSASVMCNCPSTLVVPSVVNHSSNGSLIQCKSNTSQSVVQPCATVYYAEPVDPSCLQCIASCPPSLICPGGYKCNGLFNSQLNSSCNNVSKSCQSNSALATAATATTTTSTGVLQRDMYC